MEEAKFSPQRQNQAQNGLNDEAFEDNASLGYDFIKDGDIRKLK